MALSQESPLEVPEAPIPRLAPRFAAAPAALPPPLAAAADPRPAPAGLGIRRRQVRTWESDEFCNAPDEFWSKGRQGVDIPPVGHYQVTPQQMVTGPMLHPIKKVPLVETLDILRLAVSTDQVVYG